MAFPCKHLFTPADRRLSSYAKALGYPARLEILRLVHFLNGMYVHEIRRMVPLGQAAVSDHLKILRENGLLEVQCKGRYNYYTVSHPTLEEVQKHMRAYFAEFEKYRV